MTDNPPDRNAAVSPPHGWIAAGTLIAGLGLLLAIGVILRLSEISDARTNVARYGLGVAWWAAVVPLVASATFFAVAGGLIRGRAWAWYVALPIAAVAGLAAVLGLIAGIRTSGEGFGAIGKFYLLLGSTILVVVVLVIAASLRALRPSVSLATAAPRAGLAAAPVVMALLAGMALSSFDAGRASSVSAARDAAAARVAGITIEVTLESAVSRAGLAEAEPPESGDWVDVEIVERMTLQMFVDSKSAVELKELRSCLRTSLPTRDRPLGPIALFRPMAATGDRVANTCWAQVGLDAALRDLFDPESSGDMGLAAGERRSATIELERDDATCDYPVGPWTLELAVLPGGWDADFDGFIVVTPSGPEDVAFTVPADPRAETMGKSERYCAVPGAR